MQNVARPFWAKNWRKIMIEELKDTEIINKVGGKFKLTALIQKRLDEMMHRIKNPEK
jgi:hypothetical protein